jgi:hypothetical protein
VALLTTITASAQVATGDVLFSVTDPRPLAKAAEQLEARYGIPIYYEDAASSYSGDLVTSGDAQFQRTHPKALIPKGGSVTIRALAGAKIAGPTDLVSVLQTALDSHAEEGNAGQFKLLQTGNGVSIIPTSVRNTNGVWVPDQSPLDAAVSFPELQSDGMEIIELIRNTIINTSGKIVELGTVPTQLLKTQTVRLGAKNEPARDVLVRMLAGLQWSDSRIITPIYKMSWQLLYAPDTQGYFLNLHQVMIEKASPTGRSVRRPVIR